VGICVGVGVFVGLGVTVAVFDEVGVVVGSNCDVDEQPVNASSAIVMTKKIFFISPPVQKRKPIFKP